MPGGCEVEQVSDDHESVLAPSGGGRLYLDDGLVGIDEWSRWELASLSGLVDQASAALGGLPKWKKADILKVLKNLYLCHGRDSWNFDEALAAAAKALNLGEIAGK